MTTEDTHCACSKQRLQALAALQQQVLDVCVIGGGIQGAAMANALQFSGYQVALVDRGDFGCGASQESSNFIWGGIKYLENAEFRLVRKLCRARNLLMQKNSSQVQEIRFCMFLPFWKSLLVYCGAWFYWLLGMCYTKTPVYLWQGRPSFLKDILPGAKHKYVVVYSDALILENDARFLYSFIRKAKNLGAVISNYTKIEKGTWNQGKEHWELKAKDSINLNNGATSETTPSFLIRSKWIVNAAGSAVRDLNQVLENYEGPKIFYSKGVHLICPQKNKKDNLSASLTKPLQPTDHPNFILSSLSSDQRPFFIIPMQHCLSIGTTDTRSDQPIGEPNAKDRAFILKNIQENFGDSYQYKTTDIISHRCGMRTLISATNPKEGDWLKLSRKHLLLNNAEKRISSAFGGKLTDCINIGEEILAAFSKQKKETVLPHKSHVAWHQEFYGENDQKSQLITQCENLLLAIQEDNLPQSERKLQAKSLAFIFWRRYLENMKLFNQKLEKWHSKSKHYSSLITEMIPRCQVIRFEWFFCREAEFVTSWSDFTRRRTKLANLYTESELKQVQIELQNLEVQM